MKLRKGKERVLVISDIQTPFHHPDTVRFLDALKREVKPTKIVNAGDSVDGYTFAKFARDPATMNPTDELRKAKKTLKELFRLFPKAVEVNSNHNSRLVKRAMEAGIPAEFVKSYKDLLSSPWDYTDRVTIDNIVYEHGEAYGGVTPFRNAVVSAMQSIVIGHHHQAAGISYVSNDKEMLFGMCVGCLIDVDSYAFAYSKNYKFKPTLSAGVVLYGVPKLVPMLIGPGGRWNGEMVL